MGRDAGWANGCLITLSSSLDTSSPDGTHPSVCNPESSTKLFLLRDVETGKFPTDNAQETAQKDCHTEPQGTPELMFSLHQTHQPKLGAPGGLAPSQKKNKPKTSCLLLISLLPSQPPPFQGSLPDAIPQLSPYPPQSNQIHNLIRQKNEENVGLPASPLTGRRPTANLENVIAE